MTGARVVLNNIKCGEHTGTHFDAPVHWVTGQDLPDNMTDTLLPERFIGPAVVIDAVAEAENDPDFLMSLDFVKAWRPRTVSALMVHGCFIAPTGPKKNPRRRTSTRMRPGATPLAGIPRPSPFGAGRDIIGVGAETVGTDSGQAAGQDPMFPCHNLMHGANKCGLASLRNLDQLPPQQALS